MSLRLYLAGQLLIEADSKTVDQRAFPGRQGRCAFAYLICERWRPVSRDELAEAIWTDELPAAWDNALSALVSKLRGAIAGTGADILRFSSAYQLRLPGGSWVDIEAAASSLHEAESLLGRRDSRAAWGPANVAATITARRFLPGDEAEWIEKHRTHLRGVHLRALECLALLCLENSETSLAAQFANQVLAAEPFRETALRTLMNAHDLAGNRAEGLQAYERFREKLLDELGADPSPETEQLFLDLIRRE